MRCWVRATSSRWTELTSSSSWRPRSRRRSRASRSSCSRLVRLCSTRVRSAEASATDSSSRASTTAAPRPTASATCPSSSSCSRRAIAAARASRSARAAPSSVSARPCRARARSSVVRRASRVSISAARAVRETSARRSRSVVSGTSSGDSSAATSRASSSARPSRSLSRATLAASIAWSRRAASALALRTWELYCAELLGDGGQGGVGLVQLGQGDIDATPCLLALALERRDVEGEPLQGVRRRAQRSGGLVDRGLHLDQARLARGAAGSEVGPDEVTVAGDRGQVRGVTDEPSRRGEVVHHDDLVQQAGQRGTKVLGALHHVHGVRRAARQPRPGRVVDLGTAEQDPRPAQVVVLQVGDRADGRVDIAYGDGVGRAPEGCGDGRLEALLDAEQRGHRPEHPVDRVRGGEQRTRAVLAVQAELERFLAGAERAALPLGSGELLAVLGQPVLDVGQRRAGRLVLGVEAFLAGVETGDPGLQRGEVVLGALGAADDLGAGLR